jgi:hypothetical protein
MKHIPIILLLAFTFCSSPQKMIDGVPADFGFILHYGVEGRNVLNTFKESYTKDLIMDGTKTVPLVLSDKEMKGIYEEMKRMDILSAGECPCQQDILLTNDSSGNHTATVYSIVHSSPHTAIILHVRMDGRENTIEWDLDNCRCEDAKWFEYLLYDIRKILEHTEEYKSLPKAKGGYM